MRILLTNDDGINARGLKLLEAVARRLSDDIWIVAPTEEQSGAGHSLTLTTPVRLRKHDERRFSVTGTPTDAVMLALAHIMKDSPPDVIMSGINRGANLAEDVTYSGTVSAAMEGALAGVRSIALSQAYSREGMGDTVPFGAANCGVFRRLKMSALNSPRILCGNEKSFAIVASMLTYFGPSRTPLRAALPHVSGGAAEKIDVSNHNLPGPMLPSTAGVPPTLGRCVFPGACRLLPFAVK